MKSLMALILFSAFHGMAKSPKSESFTFKSEFEFSFYDRKADPFGDMGKVSEFHGSLEILDSRLKDLGPAEAYFFPQEKSLKITEPLCEKYTRHIWGNEKIKASKVEAKPKMWVSSVGPVCQFLISEDFLTEPSRYKILEMGFIHGKLMALSWNLQKNPDKNVEEQLQTFWKSLK